MKRLVLAALFGFVGAVSATAEGDGDSRYQLFRENPLESLCGSPIQYILCKYCGNKSQQEREFVKFSGQHKTREDGMTLFEVYELTPLNGFKSQRHMRLISRFMKRPIFISDHVENSFLFYDKDA